MYSNLNKLSLAFLISILGDWLFRLAIPLMIYNSTNSALYMAIAYGVTYLPNIFFTIFGGIIADISDKRTILMVGDIVASVLSFLFALFIILDINSTYLTMLFVFLMSAVSAFYYPAHQAIIPEIVPSNHYVMANARLRSIDNVLLVLAPSISAIVITLLSIKIAILMNAFSFLMSFFIIKKIKIDKAELPKKKTSINNLNQLFILSHFRLKFYEGFTLAFSILDVRRACYIFIVVNLAMSIFFSNFMYLMKEFYSLSNYDIGVTYSIIGLGALLGSLSSRVVINRLGEAKSIVFAVSSSFVFFIGLAISDSYIFIALSWSGVTFFNSIVIVSYFTLRQKCVPANKLGIVVAITRTLVIICIPIGAIIGGVIINITNNPLALKYTALVLMLVAVTYALSCGLAGDKKCTK